MLLSLISEDNHVVESLPVCAIRSLYSAVPMLFPVVQYVRSLVLPSDSLDSTSGKVLVVRCFFPLIRPRCFPTGSDYPRCRALYQQSYERMYRNVRLQATLRRFVYGCCYTTALAGDRRGRVGGESFQMRGASNRAIVAEAKETRNAVQMYQFALHSPCASRA